MSTTKSQPDIDQLIMRIQSGSRTELAAATTGAAKPAASPLKHAHPAELTSSAGNANVPAERFQHSLNLDLRTSLESMLGSSRIMQTRLNALEGMNQLSMAAAGLNDILGQARHKPQAQVFSSNEAPSHSSNADGPARMEGNGWSATALTDKAREPDKSASGPLTAAVSLPAGAAPKVVASTDMNSAPDRSVPSGPPTTGGKQNQQLRAAGSPGGAPDEKPVPHEQTVEVLPRAFPESREAGGPKFKEQDSDASADTRTVSQLQQRFEDFEKRLLDKITKQNAAAVETGNQLRLRLEALEKSLQEQSQRAKIADQTAAAANESFLAEVRSKMSEFTERVGSASGALAEAMHRIEQNELDGLELARGLERLQREQETIGKNIKSLGMQSDENQGAGKVKLNRLKSDLALARKIKHERDEDAELGAEQRSDRADERDRVLTQKWFRDTEAGVAGDIGKLFQPGKPVICFAAGLGESVAALLEDGIDAYGVETDDKRVQFCRRRGLPVVQADLLDHLQSLPDLSEKSLFLGRWLQRLPTEQINRVLELCRAKMRFNTHLVIECVNPACPQAMAEFHGDPLNIRPVPASLLYPALIDCGFDPDPPIYADPVSADIPATNRPEVGLVDDTAQLYRIYLVSAVRKQV